MRFSVNFLFLFLSWGLLWVVILFLALIDFTLLYFEWRSWSWLYVAVLDLNSCLLPIVETLRILLDSLRETSRAILWRRWTIRVYSKLRKAHRNTLKAFQRDAIANLRSFSDPEHQRLNSDGFIYIRYAPTLFRLAVAEGGWNSGSIFRHNLSSWKPSQNKQFWLPNFYKRGALGFFMCICKFGLLPNMSQSLLEFCSVTSLCEENQWMFCLWPTARDNRV